MMNQDDAQEIAQLVVKELAMVAFNSCQFRA